MGSRGLPFRKWPLWKTVLLGIGVYGGWGAVLTFSASYPPVFAPATVAVLSFGLAVLGVAAMVWYRQTLSWTARAAVGVFFSVLLFVFAWRGWFAVLSGIWLWIVVVSVGGLVTLGWALPLLANPLSATLWREQNAPQTRVGRTTLKWLLGLGLGGAGVVGASFGMATARTGQASIAYLVLAIGMSIVAFFMAQGYSHRLWQEKSGNRSRAQRA